MEEPIVRVIISQVLNLGFDLRQRLQAVADREHIDATCLGAGSSTEAGEPGHE
jgi:hypothetical protein